MGSFKWIAIAIVNSMAHRNTIALDFHGPMGESKHVVIMCDDVCRGYHQHAWSVILGHLDIGHSTNGCRNHKYIAAQFDHCTNVVDASCLELEKTKTNRDGLEKTRESVPQ